MKTVIRVLIVDDSAVYREFLAHVLGADPFIQVVGAARDGPAAFDAVTTLRPDVITMDINMPGMSGYEVTRRIMETIPTPIIVVSAADDISDVEMSFKAMESGAVAVVSKVRGGDSPDAEAQTRELIQMVKLMAEVKVIKRWARKVSSGYDHTDVGADHSVSVTLPRKLSAAGVPGGVSAILIGASTGGPLPIRTILSALPPGFPSAVLIVQHIAAGFVNGFSDWLAEASRLPVHVAAEGEPINAGHVYIAPDETHMGVRAGPRVSLSRSDPEHGLRPAVSYLFRSAASVFGKKVVGVLLSGMGTDGAEEMKALRDLGAVTFAQDSESCVVYGMPGEAVMLGGATYTLPPEAIASALVSIAGNVGSMRSIR
jgi:two-component system, chemotaxis family, protein-glutamate methylesterase/glutaminase